LEFEFIQCLPSAGGLRGLVGKKKPADTHDGCMAHWLAPQEPAGTRSASCFIMQSPVENNAAGAQEPAGLQLLSVYLLPPVQTSQAETDLQLPAGQILYRPFTVFQITSTLNTKPLLDARHGSGGGG
jgi:hypothetical protein